jgi:hypothetical protein
VSFQACQGQGAEGRLFFQSNGGGEGDEFARLTFDGSSLSAKPDGTPFTAGECITITMSLADPQSATCCSARAQRVALRLQSPGSAPVGLRRGGRSRFGHRETGSLSGGKRQQEIRSSRSDRRCSKTSGRSRRTLSASAGTHSPTEPSERVHDPRPDARACSPDPGAGAQRTICGRAANVS